MNCNMTDNLDELRRQWQKISVHDDCLDHANAQISERLAHGHVASLQQTLYKSVRRKIFIGLLLPILAPALYFTLGLPVWICIIYAAFGLLMSLLQYSFAKFINEKDLMSLPVAEAFQRAIIIKIRHKRQHFIGYILGLLLCVTLAWALPDEDKLYLLIAGAIGLIIGLAISIPIMIRDRRLLRQIISTLTQSH